jgi:hypothetical protein
MTLKIEANTFAAGRYDDLTEVGATLLNEARGCRQAANMITLLQGPAVTRPPSRYIASTKGQGAARLFDVIYSDLYAFLVELGDGYARFYTNSGQIVSGGAAYEIVSPYGAADLADLQVYNDAGTLYLTHPDYWPQALVYAGATSWTLGAAGLVWGPFRDLNDTVCTLTPSGTTGNITLTATGGTPFVTGAGGHVGAKWLIGHSVGQAVLSHTFTADDTSATIAVSKGAAWQISTSGSWDGTLTVQRSYDGGSTWEAALTLESSKDVNYPGEPGVETIDDATYRLVMTNWATSTSCKASFTVPAHVQYGYVTITAVTSATLASATVVQPLAAATATALWAEGSWSPYRGYPRCVGLIDNRLTFGANLAEPTTLWFSHTNQYLNFRTGTAPADALAFTFTVQRGDPFLWIIGGAYQFYVGTPSKMLEMQTADPRSAITLTNKPEIARQIEFGVSAVPPVRAHATIIMMDPANLRPMPIEYEWQRDILTAPNLAQNCPTLTEPGIRKVVFQRGRIPILWFLRTDGKLMGCTFEQTREGGTFAAWHGPHATDGAIEDIAVLPGGSKGDVLWWVVARTIDGATQRHVEKLDELELLPVRATAHGLDAYVLWDGGAAQTVTLAVLNGTTGQVTFTVPSHGYANGTVLQCAVTGYWLWLNDHPVVVSDATTHTFKLKTTAGAYLDGRLLGATLFTTGTVQAVARTIGGLDHLEGATIYAVAAGRVLGPFTVADGEATLPDYVNYAALGLFEEAWLQPLRLVVPTPDGTTRGRQGSVRGLWLSVLRSWECEIGPDAAHRKRVCFGDPTSTPGTAPELVTDERFEQLAGALTTDPTVVIRRSVPLPLCVRALMLDADIHGLRSG